MRYSLPDPEHQLLSPMLDLVFKLLLAHPSCKSSLIALLTAVLRPKVPIVDVEVLNPDIDKDSVSERGIVLDIRCRLLDDSEIDIELQAQKRTGWKDRMLYNWAKLFTSTIHRGDAFSELPACIGIFILGYDGLQRGRFHTTFHVRDSLDHEKLSDHFELHVVELANLPMQVSSEDEALALWARFFRVTTVEELEQIAMTNEIMKQTADRLVALSNDPETQRLAQQRADELMFTDMALRAERREGREDGLRESIIRVLGLRGLYVSPAFRAGLSAKTDLAELQALLDRVLEVSCADELLDGPRNA